MKKILILFMAIIYIVMMSCNHKDDSHNHSHENDTHDHNQELDDSHDHNHGQDTEHTHDGESAHDHAVANEANKSHEHEYHTQKTELQSFNEIIKTSGEITVSPGSKIEVVASNSGRVSFVKTDLADGVDLSKNEVLFLISGDELIDNNIDLKYSESKTDFEKAESEFKRAEKLFASRIISEKEYQQIKAEYEKSKAAYELIAKKFSTGGATINAPAKGYIHELLVTEGQFVEQGQKLAVINKKDKLRLRAEVSQKYVKRINHIQSANFSVSSISEIFSTNDLNGKVISAGQSLNSSGFYIPVIFEIDYHPDLLPGSFARIYLKGETINHAVVIPKTALIEDQGSYFVFVEANHDEFEKRHVILGHEDGTRVLIQSGLKRGEVIVTEGVYQVKLASMSNELPEHSHSH